MKRSYLAIILVVLGVGLGGCGNSSIDGFQELNTTEAVEKIGISITCTTPATLDDYIELKSGDKIVKDKEESSIKLYHDENNLKRVCLQSGEAHIERSNIE